MSKRKPSQAKIRAEYHSHADAEARQFVHGAIRDWRERHRPEQEAIDASWGGVPKHTEDAVCPSQAAIDDNEIGTLRWPVRALRSHLEPLEWSHTALGVWTAASPTWDRNDAFLGFWGTPAPKAQRLWGSYGQIRLLCVEPLEQYDLSPCEAPEPTPKPAQDYDCHQDDAETQAHFAERFFAPNALLVGYGGQPIPPTYLGFDARSVNGGMPAWVRPGARLLSDANRAIDHGDYALADHKEYEHHDKRTDYTSDTRYWLFTPWAVQPFPTLESAQGALARVLLQISKLSQSASHQKPLLNAHLPAVPKDLFGEFPCPACRRHLDKHAKDYQEHYDQVLELWRSLKVLSVFAHQAARLELVTNRVTPYKTVVANPAPLTMHYIPKVDP